MDMKVIGIFLAVFFLAVATVSAAGENVTNEDGPLSVVADCDNLTIECNENASSTNDNGDCLSVSSDNASLDNGSGDCLRVSNDAGLASVKELPVAVAVESDLSSQKNESKLSMPVDQQDSKLTGIYDKVYSKKVWKSAWICSMKYKYTWSEKKINKVTKQKANYVKKRTVYLMKKYLKKGWTYSRIFYTINYGKKIVKYKFYLQFYKTVYYNGYGDVLYVC